jgi:hypothetical protein
MTFVLGTYRTEDVCARPAAIRDGSSPSWSMTSLLCSLDASPLVSDLARAGESASEFLANGPPYSQNS